MGILILKLLMSIFGAIELWLRLIVAFIMWDIKYITSPTIIDILWKKQKD